MLKYCSITEPVKLKPSQAADLGFADYCPNKLVESFSFCEARKSDLIGLHWLNITV